METELTTALQFANWIIGTLIGAVIALSGVITVMWRHGNSERARHEAAMAAVHDSYRADREAAAINATQIKELVVEVRHIASAIQQLPVILGRSGSEDR